MKLNKRELTLFVILVVLGLGFIFYRFVYAGQETDMVKLETGLKTEKNKLAVLTAKLNEDEKYIEDEKKLNTEIRSIERKVPYIKDMPGMFVDIYYMIIENGLEGNNISFGSVSEGEKYNYFNITFEVKGRKDNINEFLLKLQKYKREVSLSSISFTVGAEDSFNVSIIMKVYILKSDVPHKEPADYDFLEGKYGTFKDLYEMFRSSSKPGGKNGPKN